MILAIPEYQADPAAPAQWERYYNTLDDKIYIQVLETTDPLYPDWVQMSTGAAVREDMRIQDTLIRKKFSGKDFQTYLDQTLAYMYEQYGDEFNDFISSDPAVMIAKYICAALDEMSWYLDKESDEWYMELASLLSNVARFSRYLGYKPPPAVSGSTDITFTLTNAPYGFDVPIRKGHQVQGPNGLVFEVDTDQVVPSGDLSKLVSVYQGETFTESFISSGEPKQTFNLSLVPEGKYLAQGKSLLTVGGNEWTEEDFLPYEDSESYEINYLYSPPVLRFGDGIVGKVPPAGEEIRITYVATAGKEGGLALSNTITTNLTSIVVNFENIPVTITNEVAVAGASDPQAIDIIKSYASRWFMTADRLVTDGDYDVLASSFSDSLYGSISKASALIIRGVGEDQELQDLLAAVNDNQENLETYLNNIKDLQNNILSDTGAALTAGTIRYLIAAIKEKNVDVRAKTDDIDANVTTVQGNIEDAKSDIDLARTRLDFSPFQETIGYGDATATTFIKTLAQVPIKEGSVSVLVSDKTPAKSNSGAPDGDCDTTPGRVASVSITFASGDVGKLIRIGGEYRQITRFIDVNTVEYSGPRIYGTSLIVEVFPSSVIGYDDGAGVISGSGISSGSVDYATGVVQVIFMVAPEGITGKYGVPILCSYQYKNEGVQNVLDDADTDCDTAITNTDTFSTYGDDIDTLTTDADTSADDVITKCDEIDVDAVATKAQADLALVIPAQIENDIEALEAYLDEMLSGDCKANIVRVSCLVVDANGFYTAPSLSLKQALRTYLQARKESTVTISVVSGAFYLVGVSMLIQFKVLEQYLYSDVEPLVLAAIDEMFKGRDYQQPLLRSEYYEVVKGIEGVDYPDISVTAVAYTDPNNTETPPSVDANGNVFINTHDIITKGASIVTTEITT